MAAFEKIQCRWCLGWHTARYMCDQAANLLRQLALRGQQNDMPLIEFDGDPIQLEDMGLSPGDAILSQVVIKAGTTPVDDIHRPVLVFTGRTIHGVVLPSWVYVGDDDMIARTAKLVVDCANLAIATATAQREGRQR